MKLFIHGWNLRYIKFAEARTPETCNIKTAQNKDTKLQENDSLDTSSTPDTCD